MVINSYFSCKEENSPSFKENRILFTQESCDKDFKCCKFILLFCYLYMYLPLEKDKAVHFNKSKSPSTKDAIELSFDENVLERILNVPFLLFFSLEMILTLHLKLSLKDAVKIGPVVLERKMKMTTTDMNKFQIVRFI